MRRIGPPIFLVLLFCPLAAFSHSAGAMRFEVASVHPISQEELRQTDVKTGLIVSGRRVDFVGDSLDNLIARAFRVETQRIVGSDPRFSPEFVIRAVMPEGATWEQVPDMLRALLEERFHLKARFEIRQVKGYALVRGKSALKLNAPRELDRSVCGNWIDSRVRPGARECNERTNSRMMNASSDTDWGPIEVVNADANLREEFFRVTMPQLADRMALHLTNLSDDPPPHPYIPVVDKTGIAGEWDVVLEGYRGGMRDLLPVMDYYSRVLEKIGLRLEGGTLPADLLVVDSVDKTPTGN